MKKIGIFAMAAVFALCGAMPAAAAKEAPAKESQVRQGITKIGIVDMQKILQESKAAKAAKASFMKEMEAKREKINTKTLEVQRLEQEIARLAWIGIARPQGELVARDMPATGMRVRGGEETEIAADRGAWVRWLPKREFAGEEHDAYLVHPPYQDGVGYTFWRREVDVPQGGRLEFFTAMGEKSPERSDGVVFRVEIAAAAGDKAAPWEPIFEHTQKAAEWIRHEVPLARWAGKRVVLKFVSDCGPNDNAVTDHSHWGDVRVVGSDTAGERTEPVRFMTWLNPNAFTSTFYFSDVRSKQVDLECSIESGEPVWIRSIRVYAHPDAMYRRFEGGLVLANPSPRPYTFPLDSIAPGERFRRLEGSSQQDPTTNDGSPVAGKVILQPKEGLFLIKH